MDPLSRQIRVFLRSRWAKPTVTLAGFGLVVLVAYLALVVFPDRKAAQQRKQEYEAKEWLLLREPLPEEDPGLEERHIAWDEIEHKRIDPDYQIPPHKLALIKKHWSEITSGWREDQIEALKRRLGLEDPNTPPPSPSP